MNIKISELPNTTLPYTGSEVIPMVRSGVTGKGTLGSLTSYLSGSLAATGNTIRFESTVTALTGLSANASLENLNINTNYYNTNHITGIKIDGILWFYQLQLRASRVNNLPYLVRPVGAQPPGTLNPANYIWVNIPTFGAGDSIISDFADPVFNISGITTPVTTFNTLTATFDNCIDVLATLIKTLQTNNLIK